MRRFTNLYQSFTELLPSKLVVAMVSCTRRVKYERSVEEYVPANRSRRQIKKGTSCPKVEKKPITLQEVRERGLDKNHE